MKKAFFAALALVALSTPVAVAQTLPTFTYPSSQPDSGTFLFAPTSGLRRGSYVIGITVMNERPTATLIAEIEADGALMGADYTLFLPAADRFSTIGIHYRNAM